MLNKLAQKSRDKLRYIKLTEATNFQTATIFFKPKLVKSLIKVSNTETIKLQEIMFLSSSTTQLLRCCHLT